MKTYALHNKMQITTGEHTIYTVVQCHARKYHANIKKDKGNGNAKNNNDNDDDDAPHRDKIKYARIKIQHTNAFSIDVFFRSVATTKACTIC